MRPDPAPRLSSRAGRVFWIFGASVLCYAALVAAGAYALPARVPLHFGGSGAVDRWGSRTELVGVQVVVGLLLLAVFLGGREMLRRGSLRLLNVPHKQWWTATPERVAVLRRRGVEDLDAIGALTFGFLSGLWLVLLGVASDTGATEPRLPLSAWLLLGGYLLALTAYCGIAARRYRPSEA